jgi:hypothetical protein
MGNRAVIAFTGGPGAGNGSVYNNTPCVYLHWNGGYASVMGFLRAAVNLGYHKLATETERRDATARLAQAWFVKGSVYVGPYFKMDSDNFDNGTYVVDCDLDIVERRFVRHGEEIDEPKTDAIFTECYAMGQVLGPALKSVRLHA